MPWLNNQNNTIYRLKTKKPASFPVEENTTQINIRELLVGSRLIVQTKKDWRAAVVSAVLEEQIILRVCSPSGRTYRKSCSFETIVNLDNKIPLLRINEEGESWRGNFARYDFRW
jgi:hypothetical protein